MAAATPLSARDTDRLLKAILVLTRTVDQVLETGAVRAALDPPLSASKIQTLRLLGARKGQTSVQVANHLGVSKPAVSQIIADMVKMGLVSRVSDAGDRREVILDLTATGRRALQALRRQQRHLLRNTLRLAKSGEAEAWIDTLHDMASSLARSDRAFDRTCLQCGAHADGTCVLVGGDARCPFLQQRGATLGRRRKG